MPNLARPVHVGSRDLQAVMRLIDRRARGPRLMRGINAAAWLLRENDTLCVTSNVVVQGPTRLWVLTLSRLH